VPRQLIGQVRSPLAPQPGKPLRYDYHYKRGGVVNLVMFFEPLAAWRMVMTRERRTKIDWAQCMRTLLITYYLKAKKSS
jgi:hypothetical protein